MLTRHKMLNICFGAGLSFCITNNFEELPGRIKLHNSRVAVSVGHKEDSSLIGNSNGGRLTKVLFVDPRDECLAQHQIRLGGTGRKLERDNSIKLPNINWLAG